MALDTLDYTIWTDGGCAQNPNGKGGYGVVIINNNTSDKETFQQGFLSTTNNRMEVRAIMRALEEIPDGASALIYSDSKYAILTLEGTYRKKKNLDLWAIAEALISKKRNIIFEWTKGHADDENNNLCDEMATAAQNGDDFIVDDGFVPLATKQSKTPNKALQNAIEGDDVSTPVISISSVSSVSALNAIIEPMFTDAYVNPDCANKIHEINLKSKPSFSDFSGLRVGGKDFWSVQSFDVLKFYFGAYICNYVISNIADETSAASALRWYGRGLRMEHAIRKIYVDIEINNNRKSI